MAVTGKGGAEFAEYAAARWRTLVHAAMLLGAGFPEAEDLAQATLIRAHASWGRVSTADNVDAYVSRMLLNGFRASRRRHWWRERPSLFVPDVTQADRTVEIEAVELVERALGRLSVEQREVVVLRFFTHLSEAETAEVLGIARGTVKSRLSRALDRLSRDPDLADLNDGSSA